MACCGDVCTMPQKPSQRNDPYIKSGLRKPKVPVLPSAPRFFWDVDSEAKELFSSYFHPGVLHLNLHTNVSEGTNVDITGHHYTESKSTTCSVGVVKETGFGEVSSRILSSNQLQLQASFIDTFFSNLNQTVIAKINYCALETSHIGMDNAFRHDNVALSLGMKFKEKLPRLTFSSVFGARGYFVGLQSSVSTHKAQLTGLDGVMGYRHGDTFAFSGRVCDWGTCYQATVWQRLSQRLQYAATLQWRQVAAPSASLEEEASGCCSGPGSVGVTVSGKWNLSSQPATGTLGSEGTFVKLQFSNHQVNPLSFALSFPLLETARLTMSTDFSLRDALTGGKLGLSLEVEG